MLEFIVYGITGAFLVNAICYYLNKKKEKQNMHTTMLVGYKMAQHHYNMTGEMLPPSYFSQAAVMHCERYGLYK